ncbi:MAG: 8-oxo-dGTP diphosphatase MutT [Gammaproteobacteria bacterium]|nr:8-oxo-dGTP diphosphatase MutT [Gammaproteobacteria bacterium]
MHAVIDIALGIIFNEQQQLLIALRTKDSDQGNLWELPGGKVEAEESVEAALVREMHEELAIIVKRVQPIMSVAHRYHNRTVRLQTFHIIDYQGRIIGAEGQPLRWVALQQLPTIQFPAANKPIIDWLLSA